MPFLVQGSESFRRNEAWNEKIAGVYEKGWKLMVNALGGRQALSWPGFDFPALLLMNNVTLGTLLNLSEPPCSLIKWWTSRLVRLLRAFHELMQQTQDCHHHILRWGFYLTQPGPQCQARSPSAPPHSSFVSVSDSFFYLCFFNPCCLLHPPIPSSVSVLLALCIVGKLDHVQTEPTESSPELPNRKRMRATAVNLNFLVATLEN